MNLLKRDSAVGVFERVTLSSDLSVRAPVWEQATFGGAKDILPEFPKFARKTSLSDKLSPYKFSVAVGALYLSLSSCYGLENRKIGTWNWVRNNPTEPPFSALPRAPPTPFPPLRKEDMNENI